MSKQIATATIEEIRKRGRDEVKKNK